MEYYYNKFNRYEYTNILKVSYVEFKGIYLQK